MDKYQKILFITLCLMLMAKVQRPVKRNFSYKHTSYKTTKTFEHRELYKIFMASTIGVKIPFKKKTKELFKGLNLYHLFTPSGIHLSSILFFISPLFKLAGRKSKKLSTLVFCGLLVIPWTFGYYLSIKRIVLLKLSSYILSKIFKWELKTFNLFIIIFSIDYIFGTYSQSPFSFIYSFLFLGIIFSKDSSSTPLPYLFWGGQVLISLGTDNLLTVLGPFLGFFLTIIFSLCFPILLSYHFLSYFIDFNYAEFILVYFYKLANLSYNLAFSSGTYNSSIPLLIAAFLISGRYKKYIPYLIITHSSMVL